eukprot:TRINITY_DN14959_c0_g1_i1.p1 TRINITY_DN14959_c0_g1~~TRINITY_DN14959_c0_g1_i1.p1  ORF type:complete len:237 (+),score=85.33 TRINITY_DN14959_c0_g1_i1:55-765(+)
MARAPKLLLLGPPGSGKSFYGKMLSREYGVPFYSMGKVLAARMPDAIKARMQLGELVPPEEVYKVYLGMREELGQGYILDGFPRSLEQVGMYARAAAAEPALRADYGLHFTLPRPVLRQKLLGRRECANCGANWNVADVNEGGIVMPAILPKTAAPDTCECGTPFAMRADDTAAVIDARQDRHEALWAELEPALRDVLPIIDFPLKGGADATWPSLMAELDPRVQGLGPAAGAASA